MGRKWSFGQRCAMISRETKEREREIMNDTHAAMR